ncbi:MAG: hypothetical protein ABIT01_15225 [Thermoanaerobaculia bacterium]
MHSGSHPVLPAVAACILVFVTSLYLLLGLALHYAMLSVGSSRSFGFAAVAIGAALLHERLIRGSLYRVFQRRFAPGAAAAALAAVGALAPVLARHFLLPRPSAPLPLVIAQSILVELSISFALTWLALGSGSTWPGGVALGLIWAVRLALVITFHGGVVPFLEVVAAMAGALAIAAVLVRALAPYRDQVLGAS